MRKIDKGVPVESFSEFVKAHPNARWEDAKDVSRIGIYQNNFKSLFLKSLARLTSCIIKFRSLTNNNRTRTNNHYLMNIWI